MNLEEELNIINSSNLVEGEMTKPAYENNTNQFQNDMNLFQNNMNQFQNNMNQFQNNMNQFQNNNEQNNMNQTQIQQPSYAAQPSMVNPNQAQAQTNTFNFANTECDVSKPQNDRNPIEKLSGNQGDIFRIHLLPGVSTKKVFIHYNEERKHNFICLKYSYGTAAEDCCIKYGDSKPRFIIPVIVMPIVNGQPNNLMVGQPGRLSTLVLGPTQLRELQEQAKFAGVDILDCDIIASVNNPKFKSFNFAISAMSFINQIPNVADITSEWNRLSTPENLCGLAGRLITRDEYTLGYANYDKSKYEQAKNTPMSGGQLNIDPNMMAFSSQNQQMNSFQQGYGSSSTPMYQQAPYTPSQTSQNFGVGNDNHWNNF